MNQGKPDPHERVAIPLDPETALRALLQVDPNSEPVDDDDEQNERGPSD